MRHSLALLALALCCTATPPSGTTAAGSGGAPGTATGSSGAPDATQDADTGDGAPGGHGGAAGMGGGIKDAGPDVECPPQPNGGIGACVTPVADCPALTLEQSVCWRWECDCAGMLCHCLAVSAL